MREHLSKSVFLSAYPRNFIRLETSLQLFLRAFPGLQEKKKKEAETTKHDNIDHLATLSWEKEFRWPTQNFCIFNLAYGERR